MDSYESVHDRDRLSRRRLLHSLTLGAGAGALSGYAAVTATLSIPNRAEGAVKEDSNAASAANTRAGDWSYVALDRSAVAQIAYERYPDGGCAFSLFSGFMQCLAQIRGEPFRSFPCHMMRFAGGGVAHWGSLCGALIGGAAVIGLFERDKQQREDLIASLFSWYEETPLPKYLPKAAGAVPSCDTSIAESISCHISVSHWCKKAKSRTDSPERIIRCRRLTADVSEKTVELLNARLEGVCRCAGTSSQVKSCLSCHDEQRHDTIGKMQCNTCHPTLSAKHPDVPSRRDQNP